MYWGTDIKLHTVLNTAMDVGCQSHALEESLLGNELLVFIKQKGKQTLQVVHWCKAKSLKV